MGKFFHYESMRSLNSRSSLLVSRSDSELCPDLGSWSNFQHAHVILLTARDDILAMWIRPWLNKYLSDEETVVVLVLSMKCSSKSISSWSCTVTNYMTSWETLAGIINIDTYPFVTSTKKSATYSYLVMEVNCNIIRCKEVYLEEDDEDEDVCSLLLNRSSFQIQRYFVYVSWNNRNTVSNEDVTRKDTFFFEIQYQKLYLSTRPVNVYTCISNQSSIMHYLWLNLSNNYRMWHSGSVLQSRWA